MCYSHDTLELTTDGIKKLRGAYSKSFGVFLGLKKRKGYMCN